MRVCLVAVYVRFLYFDSTSQEIFGVEANEGGGPRQISAPLNCSRGRKQHSLWEPSLKQQIHPPQQPPFFCIPWRVCVPWYIHGGLGWCPKYTLSQAEHHIKEWDIGLNSGLMNINNQIAWTDLLQNRLNVWCHAFWMEQKYIVTGPHEFQCCKTVKLLFFITAKAKWDSQWKSPPQELS